MSWHALLLTTCMLLTIVFMLIAGFCALQMVNGMPPGADVWANRAVFMGLVTGAFMLASRNLDCADRR